MIKKILFILLTGLMFLGCAPEEESNDTPSNCATVNVVNNSGLSVWYVYYSLSSNGYWGDDRLGASEIVTNGSTRSFSVCDCDKAYDIRADFSDATYVTDYAWTWSCGTTYTWTLNP